MSWYPAFHRTAPPDLNDRPAPAENLIAAEVARERVVMKRALRRRGFQIPADAPTGILAILYHNALGLEVSR